MAEQIEPGDRIVFYVTGVQAFGGIVRVTGEMYEDREQIWPGKPGNADPYPWRFETEPELVLDEDDFVPAVELAGRARARGQVAGRALARSPSRASSAPSPTPTPSCSSAGSAQAAPAAA